MPSFWLKQTPASLRLTSIACPAVTKFRKSFMVYPEDVEDIAIVCASSSKPAVWIIAGVVSTEQQPSKESKVKSIDIVRKFQL